VKGSSSLCAQSHLTLHIHMHTSAVDVCQVGCCCCCCRCEPHEMVFIGDRYLTDVVFGNRHGMLTIRVAPLTAKGEPPAVAAARLVENACVQRWTAAGLRAPAHSLLPAEAGSSVVVRPPPTRAP
jgi:hypothetical protein